MVVRLSRVSLSVDFAIGVGSRGGARAVGALAVALVSLLGCATTGPDDVTVTEERVGPRPALQRGLAAPAGSTEGISDSDPDGIENASFAGVAAPPVVVVMTDVPAGVLDPRTLDPESRGKGRIPSPISYEEAERLRREALELGPDPLVQWVFPVDTRLPLLQRAGPVAAATSFDSLDYTECCGGGGNVPPDPELAVGPGHIIAVVNVAFEIYDKTGAVLKAPTTFSSFFSAVPGCSSVFDPNVLYDESADRFILAIDGNGDRYCIATSVTGDPLGSWHLTSVDTSPTTSNFFDYPQAGVGFEAIYVGGNIFSPGGVSYVESRVWAIDKAALYAGSPAAYVSHSTTADNYTPQPMNLHGFNHGTWPAGSPHYILTDRYDGKTHTVWAWDDPFGGNTFGKVNGVAGLNLATVTGVTTAFPVNAPQFGGSSLQANDWRGQDTEYRNGHIWMTNSVACNPGSGTVDCVQWAEIDPTVPSVVQAGVFASGGDFRIFPDLAVDHCDNMAIGYTKTSTTTFPSVWFAGREAGDSPGTLSGPETLLKAGEITYTAFDPVPRRWGDYTGLTIDPDGKTFWYLGEYSKNTGTTSGRWGTWIGSMTVPSCIACGSRVLIDAGPITNMRVEEACSSITAGPYVIGTPGNVTFRAGEIILRDGFVAAGTFRAEIVP